VLRGGIHVETGHKKKYIISPQPWQGLNRHWEGEWGEGGPPTIFSLKVALSSHRDPPPLLLGSNVTKKPWAVEG
jgi:hypothetical protein